MSGGLAPVVESLPERLALTDWRVAVGGPRRTSTRHGPDGMAMRSVVLGQGLAVELEPGHAQIAETADGGYVVTFAGLLHNARELAGDDGWHANGDDASTILRAYQRRGPDLLPRLNGVFALVVLDRARGVVLAVRDPVGTHPLFHARVSGGVVISPSIETLLAHPNVSRDLNRGALVEHLVARWERPDETYYRDVRRVPAGHVLRVSSLGVEVHRYWTPTCPVDDAAWIRADELERFDGLLEQAVRRCLRGRTAVYLSGGFDSVSIGAVATDLARQRGEEPPLALSLGFPDPTCDEERVQKGVASGLGIPQVFLPLEEAVRPEGLLVAALRMSAGWPVPLMNLCRPGYLQLGVEGRRQGCRGILTGLGGDDWLTVDSLHLADLARGLDLGRFWRLTANQLRSHGLPRLTMLRFLLWKSGLRPILVTQARRALRSAAPTALPAHYRRQYLAQAPSWMAADPELRRDMAERVEEIATRVAAEREPSGPFGFYFHRFAQAFARAFQSMEMEEDFEAGRRMGLPLLMPYWDLDLIDFLVRTPPDLLNQGGRSKGLVRASVARRFPQLGFERHRKVSSLEFYRKLLQREGPGAYALMGRPSALIGLGVVDGSSIDGVLRSSLVSRQVSRAHRVWQVLNLEAWIRRSV